MRSPVQRRSAVVLILLVFFVPALLRAAPARGPEKAVAEHGAEGFFDLVRSVLAVFLGKSGSVADPRGAALTGDNGSWIDPSGNRLTPDNGSGFDPDGRT